MIKKLPDAMYVSEGKLIERINELIDAHNDLEKSFRNHFHHANELQLGTQGPIIYKPT